MKDPHQPSKPGPGNFEPACPTDADSTSCPNDLRLNEEKLSLIFNHVNDIVYEMAADRTILSVNPAFEKNLGWSAAEWIGKSASQLIHSQNVELANQRLKKFIQGPAQRVEARCQNPHFQRVQYRDDGRRTG
jgi:PAS domain S-box-containing protein